VHEAVVDENEDRRALRKRLRDERAALSPADVRAASEAVCAQLRSLPAFARARRIAFYAATQNEIDPAALAAEKEAAWPRVDGERLSFRRGPLAPGSFGILEPAPGAPLVEPIELVLVPGVAFSYDGNRLGYGRGFYDRALASMPGALRVGLCHRFQLVSAIARREGDEPVDFIVTPEGARATGARPTKEIS
jgi:5-formyltetrahydrofolate cyclo-ligase